MLSTPCAAGGADVHPHTVSDISDRERWDKDVANFNEDLKRVEAFFLEVADGKLSGDAETKAGFAFFGIQGPWYTVGWKMAVVIEKAYGRKRLIDAFCDSGQLLPTYNSAAKRFNKSARKPTGLWSEDLLRRLR